VQKALGSSLSSAQWLLAALQRLDLCLPVGDAPNPPGCPGPSGAKLFILPPLLEFGAPSQDVWPDMPEWDEKQVRVALRCRLSVSSLVFDAAGGRREHRFPFRHPCLSLLCQDNSTN